MCAAYAQDTQSTKPCIPEKKEDRNINKDAFIVFTETGRVDSIECSAGAVHDKCDVGDSTISIK